MQRLLLAVQVVCLGLLVVCLALLLQRPSPTEPSPPTALSSGSVTAAQLWRKRFAGLADPEAARAAHPEVVGKRFRDGRWAFGVSLDSHGSPDGGTIVLKDSTGAVRAFFGHVCGPRFLERVLQVVDSVEGLYEELGTGQESGFRFGEYLFPRED